MFSEEPFGGFTEYGHERNRTGDVLSELSRILVARGSKPKLAARHYPRISMPLTDDENNTDDYDTESNFINEMMITDARISI